MRHLPERLRRSSSDPCQAPVEVASTVVARWCRRLVLAGAAGCGGLLLALLNPASSAQAYEVADFGADSEFSFDSSVDLRPFEISASPSVRYPVDTFDITDFRIDTLDTFDFAAVTVDLTPVWRSVAPKPVVDVPAPGEPVDQTKALDTGPDDDMGDADVTPAVDVTPPPSMPQPIAPDPVSTPGDVSVLEDVAVLQDSSSAVPDTTTDAGADPYTEPLPSDGPQPTGDLTTPLSAGSHADDGRGAVVAPVDSFRQREPIGGGIAASDEFGISMLADIADENFTVAVDPTVLPDPDSSEIWSPLLPLSLGDESLSAQVQLSDDAAMPLQDRFGGTIVAGPAGTTAPQGAEPTPTEFGLADGDMRFSERQLGGDPGAAFWTGGGVGASDCLYFGTGGLFARGGIFGRAGIPACLGFSGLVAGTTSSSSLFAQRYLGESQPGHKLCIVGDHGCWTQKPGTFDPAGLAGGAAASIPECQTGFVLKGWPGCVVAFTQGVSAYAAGALQQPGPEWTYELPSATGGSVLDALTTPEVRNGNRAVVAGLGTTAPLTMTRGADLEVMGKIAGTGAVLGGLRTFAVTYSWQGALSNAAVSAFGYTVGSAPPEVWTVNPLSAQETSELDATIADNRTRWAELESQSPPPLGPEQFVTPELYDGLKHTARLAGWPSEIDLRLAPVDAVEYRELLNQIGQAKEDAIRLAELRTLPPQTPGPENHVTQQLVDGLIYGLGDPEHRLAGLHRRAKVMLTADGQPERTTIVEVVPSKNGAPAVYEVRSGSAVVCSDGSICPGLFAIVDGKVVDLTAVPAPPAPAPPPSLVNRPIQMFQEAFKSGDDAFGDSLDQLGDSAAAIPGRVLPPDPWAAAGEPNPLQVGAQAWNTYGKPAADVFGEGAGLAVQSGTKYFGDTLPALTNDTLDVLRQALTRGFSTPACHGGGPCPGTVAPGRSNGGSDPSKPNLPSPDSNNRGDDRSGTRGTLPAADVAALRDEVVLYREMALVLFDVELPTASSVFNQFPFLATSKGYTKRQAAEAVDGVYSADEYGLLREGAIIYRIPPD